MIYFCSGRFIYQATNGATLGRKHTDDYDKHVSREHVRMECYENFAILEVLGNNGIAVWSALLGKWTYFEKGTRTVVVANDMLSLHVIRSSPCRKDSLTMHNMNRAACFGIVGEEDLD